MKKERNLIKLLNIFSTFSIALSPLAIISKSCVRKEENEKVVPTEKFIYTKENAINEWNLFKENLINSIDFYYKKNKPESIKKLLETTYENYLDFASHNKNALLVNIKNKKEERDIGFLNNIDKFYKAFIENISIFFDRLKTSDEIKSKLYVYSNTTIEFFTSSLLKKVSTIISDNNIDISINNDLFIRRMFTNIKSIVFELLVDYLNNIQKKYFENNVTIPQKMKNFVGEIRIFEKTIEDEIINELKNSKIPKTIFIKNIFKEIATKLSNKIDALINNIFASDEQEIIDKELGKLNTYFRIFFDGVESELIPLIFEYKIFNSKLLDTKISLGDIKQTIVNNKLFDLETIKEILKSNTNEKINDYIEVFITTGFLNEYKTNFENIVSNIEKFYIERNMSDYLKNDFNIKISIVINQYIENKIYEIIDFILKHIKNKELVYTSKLYLSSPEKFLSFKSNLDSIYIPSENEAVNRSILESNLISKKEKFGLLFDFISDYLQKTFQIAIDLDISEKINNPFTLLSGLVELKNEYKKQRDEIIDKLQLEVSEKASFKQKYEKYNKAFEDLIIAAVPLIIKINNTEEFFKKLEKVK
ncbi:hypothetical protein [Metamycoplasma hyosynoviae]|uniref:hypothetical protein n=3 Tax=Metamycoplasma hyosynoviae TaxID=29559 RepID=UPI0020C88483|nr:hypothetical protein [Metamycoplasma hyosynoviae]MDC8918478.1 hypothetical protein [Metamycoplasma hyosynoviae]MDD1358398.1 hypothetical protein [Metamycoplasma hyosynoviae]MDD1361533.1 hypothetical protein [Metamycoplasma hyosynoviae]MDD7895853.1 hypothetical protein [Metamycoplasma hyosynoviae]UTO26681.1 hypothetical protein NMG94_00370 [Metamycoplasma hyosynoviae]